MGKPDIIYEDNDIIVCYKPAGIATQTRRIGQQDMESFIRNYRAAKNEPPYVGIVHTRWLLSAVDRAYLSVTDICHHQSEK